MRSAVSMGGALVSAAAATIALAAPASAAEQPTIQTCSNCGCVDFTYTPREGTSVVGHIRVASGKGAILGGHYYIVWGGGERPDAGGLSPGWWNSTAHLPHTYRRPGSFNANLSGYADTAFGGRCHFLPISIPVST